MRLLLAGGQRCTGYKVFSDLAMSRLPAVGVLGLTPPGLDTPLGILQPWVQVLVRSTHKLSTITPCFSLGSRLRGPLCLAPGRLGPAAQWPSGMALRRRRPQPLKPRGRIPGPPAALLCRGTSVSQLREAPRGRGDQAPPPPPSPAAGAIVFMPQLRHARHCGDGVAGCRGPLGYGQARGGPGGPTARH